MKIKILSSAFEDLLKGRRFYEKQASGVGDYFFDSLFSDIDSLTLYGGIHEKHFNFFRMLSKRFPYAIYYTIEDNEVLLVWRILDMRSNPDILKSELEKDR